MIGRISKTILKPNKLRAFFGSSVNFPRISKDEVALNWELAASLVTPFNGVSFNSVSGGSGTTGNSTLALENFPKQHHVNIAKAISRSATVYVEEGEFKGIIFRIITGDSSLAAAARGLLSSTQAFERGVTVLLDNSVNLNGNSYLNKQKRILISNTISDSLLTNIINDGGIQ